MLACAAMRPVATKRTTPLALALLSGLSCGTPEALQTYDLVRILPAADVLTETTALDIGTDTARAACTGLSWNETNGEGRTFAWSRGPTTTCELVLATARSGALVLEGFAWPGAQSQRVDVALNGAALGSHPLQSGSVHRLEVPVDAAQLVLGRNTVSLRYAEVRQPDEETPDARPIAVGWHTLELVTPQPAASPGAPVADLLRDRLDIPVGGLVEYPLYLEEGTLLVARRARATGDAALHVALRRADAPIESVPEATGSRALEVTLPISVTGPHVLTLAVSGTQGRVRLQNPRLELRP